MKHLFLISHKVLLLPSLLVLSFLIKAQTPNEDLEHYVLDTYDNFNTFNSNLWNRVPYMTWGLETYNANNVTASGGVLTLKCEKIGNNYISGGIETANKKTFSYGYFEIEIKTPASGNKGPWGGFWMHTGEGGWDEIDVFEPNGNDNYLGTQFHSGISATHNGIHRLSSETHPNHFTGYPDLSANFHKFAVIWTPKYVNVLFNGTSVYEIVEPEYIPSHPMVLFLTFQIDAWGGAPNSSTSFPLYWQFKNFKYYRLKTDCSHGITQTNFDFVSHANKYKVQKFYSLTNSTVPNNKNIVLRATDYIELKGEFTVPLGSTFTAITHCYTCPD
ncbi:glycoside hydrolase family 16 protein [Odoribacter sp. OttesenSCG-928-L07]|nr:glycoside hydrolase family 16 protein [Odoribacter sp. OttesenSCG-928-L07]MDL2239971.1 glycoside hydrolase family 16 protein [Bacteroidales bacterium OttesenSCG-928-L14]MDL2241272.1 glycoside hydrolase family 16 protein [Bacteroidales bacterium OttesenSCG-928-K22]